MPDAPRRKGRPPLDPTDPSVEMCVRLPATQYAALYARARELRISVPELIRRRVYRALYPRPPQPAKS